MAQDQDQFQRKLTAILSADVAGYSRLIGEDEASTVRALKCCRKLITTRIQTFKGRVVDSPGDNLLAEFGSIVDAVTCAVEIQQELKDMNMGLPENGKMRFRMGVHLGDVIEDEGRIYGEGVNMAARMESMADPGGVSISGTAFDSVRSKLHYGYKFLGEHKVKNIANPVRVYKILMKPEHAKKLVGEKRYLGPISRGVAITIIAFLIIVSAGLTAYHIYQYQSGRIEPASLEKMAFPLPGPPSIAVLPFANLSQDSAQDYICDGITDQVITSLSNVPFLFVIARNSAFNYKNKNLKIRQVSEGLGVQYILEGSIQRSNADIRIMVRLIDAVKGNHLWTERFDRKWSDIFSIYDEITMKILAELQVKISSKDFGRDSPIKTHNLKAYETFLRGKSLSYTRNTADIHEARRLAQEAIELDSEYGAAYLLLASTYMDEIYFHRVKSRTEYIEKAESLIQQSIKWSGYDSWTHQSLGSLYLLKREFDKAVAEGRRAVESNSNSSRSHFVYGMVLGMNGNYDEAILHLQKAIRLDPVAPINYLNQLAIAYFYTANYEKALLLWGQILQQNPDYYYALMGAAAAYQLTGKLDKARFAASELMRTRPTFTVSMLEERVITRDKDGFALFCEALRQAGLPN